MVMADFYDQRRKKRSIPKEKHKFEDMPQSALPKIPIILSKNSTLTCEKDDDKIENSKGQEKISVLSKTLVKEEAAWTARNKHTNGLIPDGLSKAPHVRENLPRESLPLAALFPNMTNPCKLISGSFKWNDVGSEFLMDQANYVVVGVLGLQNVGKSTVLSYLGEIPERNQKLIFKPQTKGTRESGIHTTAGVDMFVTKERMILLDCQALLSVSNLVDLNRHEKKYAPEYARFDAGIDIQSVQLVALMMSVCNYVIVTMDWFGDERIFTILRLAEMLKPLMSYEEIQREEKTKVSSATLIFALNKANGNDEEMRSTMEREIEECMDGSRINYKGISSAHPQRVNLVFLPHMYRGSNSKPFPCTANPRGCFDFEEKMKSLGYLLMSLPRKLPINRFSEKKWLVFAMRAWDVIRKSQLMNDYDRLLS